jgi:hypothetical protein
MKKIPVVEANEGRWIAASGLVFVAAWVVGLFISFSSPAATASIADWTAYYLGHSGAAMFQTYLIDGLTAAALVVFAAALRSALRRFEGESTTLSSIVFGAGVAAASVSLVQGTFGQVLANHIAATGDAGAIRTLLELDTEADTFKLLPLALLVGATSILALRTGALPQWLGWSGAVLSVLLVVAGWSFPLNSPALGVALDVALVGLLLWVASVSVIILWRAERGTRA